MSALSVLTDQEREDLPREDQPAWTEPMLATLTEDYFSDPDWIFERKLDGERVMVFRKDGDVHLCTRNQKRVDDTYPELVEALEHDEGPDLVADGEVVAFEGNVSSFSRLQQRMQIKDPDEARASGVRVWLYLFDLLHYGGCSLEDLPLRSRKKVLKKALAFEGPIRYTQHRNTEGEAYHETACEKGWEGVIAKRADSTYVHSRSRDWLKFKCGKEQELVIGGYTDPKGERKGFGALLVGYYEDDELRYAGKVGTGFDDDFLESFRDEMDRAKRETPPFADPPDDRDVTWVTPKFVGEFGFTTWTDAGKLRHPRFLGLRRDKDAEDVVRERPADISKG